MENNYDIKKAQNRLLGMGKTIADILEKNNIPYIITLGTLLGAVRHKGFIPWDDDFDFHLFEDTYEKALDILRKELPNDMIVEYYNNEPLYFHQWAHVKDTNSITKCKQFPQDNLYKQKGLSIDLYKLNLMKIDDLNNFISKENINYLNRRKKLNLISEEEYLSRIENNKQKTYIDENDIGKNIYAFLTGYKRKYILQEDVLPLKRYKFEDYEFNGPYNANKILNEIYGNYMKLPPKSKRKSHYSKVEYK